ncbi:MAG: choice-of-anchor D domain-containing protein, partial [Verrucomicrobiota bacterium]|nr:choice-of-anchor D domain-containing protein [Verrucomicrobiota bacterium]
MFTPRSTSRLSWNLLAIVLTLSLGGPVNAQLIQIRGNDRVISNGDTTPSGDDHTSFGQVLAGSGPVDREFTIRNLSSTPLQILFFQRTGQHPGNFTVIDPPDLTIPGNGNSSMTIRFLPPAASGLRTATIRLVSSSVVNGDFRFDVAGELILPSPNIVISGNGVVIPDGFSSPVVGNNTNFETLDLDGNPLTRTFIISNTGEQDLRIRSVDVVGI